MFSESDFEKFRILVLKKAEERGNSALEEAMKKAEFLKAEAVKRGRELYRQELLKGKRELEESYRVKERELVEQIELEKEKLIKNKIDEIEKEILKGENFKRILDCFLTRARSELGQGRLLINPELAPVVPKGIACVPSDNVDFLEFENREKVFTLTRRELRKRISRFLEEKLFG